jgi:hypothetical protein
MVNVLRPDPEVPAWRTPTFLAGRNRRSEQDLPPLEKKSPLFRKIDQNLPRIRDHAQHQRNRPDEE